MILDSMVDEPRFVASITYDSIASASQINEVCDSVLSAKKILANLSFKYQKYTRCLSPVDFAT